MNTDMMNKLELNKKDKDIDKSDKWLILLIILVFLITKLPSFFSFLNSDAGAFAYIGEQILEGKVLYRDIWSAKPPGVYYLIAFIFYILPNTLLSLRIFELIYCLVTSFAVYKLSLFFYTKKTSLIVTVIYSFFSNIYVISHEGMMTENYMLLPMILAVYFFMLFKNKQKNKYLILVGLMGGLAFMFKQPGLSSIAGIFFFLIIEWVFKGITFKKLIKQYLLVIIGVGIIFSIITSYFVLKHAIPDLFSGVFVYNYWRSKAYSFGIFTVIERIMHYCFLRHGLLCLLSSTSILLYLIHFCYNSGVKGKKQGNEVINNQYFLLLMCWLIFDFFGVCIGGAFYLRYWIQVIPSLSLISGYMIESIFICPTETFKKKKIVRICRIVLVSYFILLTIGQLRYFVWHVILNKESAQEITAQWLIKNSRDNDFIYIWGDECSIAFLAKRKISGRYVHPYPIFTANHASEKKIKEFINDLKENPPKYIIDTSFTNLFLPSLLRRDLIINYRNEKLSKSLKKLYEDERLIPVINFIVDNYTLETVIKKYFIFVLNS